MGVVDPRHERGHERRHENGGNAAESKPLVLVPVTAEDFARRKRRILLRCLAAALALAGIAGWLYKRSVDPMHAAESFDAGMRLLTTARYSQAILSFDRSISLKPDFADAYLMRGHAYVGESQTEQAIADFSKVLELRPNDTRALLDRSAAYLDRKDSQSAIPDSARAIEIDPKMAEAYNLRGTALRSLGDPKKALDDFNRAVQLSPNADNYYQRGATFQILGDYKDAIADFTQVIAMKPDESPGYFARAEARRASGDVRGADADHRQARLIDSR
jgi:tetratricopeptide (TPR) repeat protein